MRRMQAAKAAWRSSVVAVVVSALVATSAMAGPLAKKGEAAIASVDENQVVAFVSGLPKTVPLGERRLLARTFANRLLFGCSTQCASALLDALIQFGENTAEVRYVADMYARSRIDALRLRGWALRLKSSDSEKAVAMLGLGNATPEVRAMCAERLAALGAKDATTKLGRLLERGDVFAAEPFAALGTADHARKLGEKIGVFPDDALAATFYAFLTKKGFGPKDMRQEVLRSLSKVPGPVAIEKLTAYVAAEPSKDDLSLHKEAEALLEARLSQP